MISFLIGAFVGSFLLTVVIGWIVEKFAFRKLPPGPRALATIGVAWLIVGTLAGFGMADGGPFQIMAYLYYLPGSLAYLLLYRRRLQRAWDAEADAFT